jgi:hypothetical protein
MGDDGAIDGFMLESSGVAELSPRRSKFEKFTLVQAFRGLACRSFWLVGAFFDPDRAGTGVIMPSEI